jgi:2-octaprenyl-6-methoxyphenol hydroxylase
MIVKQSKHYDVLIAGGGPVGLSLAYALSRLSLQVAVIEPKDFSLSERDTRIFGLSRTSQQFFAYCDVWKQMQTLACDLSSVRIRLRGHIGSWRLHAKDYGVSALGCIIPAAHVMQVLRNVCQESSAIDLYTGQRVTAIEHLPNAVRVTLSSEHQSTSHLIGNILVAADGQHSAVRALSGISAKQQDYDHVAVVGQLRLGQPLHHTAQEYLWGQGLLALLPLHPGVNAALGKTADDCCGVIMTVPKKWHDPTQSFSLLQKIIGDEYGEITVLNRLSDYPLSLSIADQVIGTRTVLLGSAAYHVHPIAAQGFNLGVRDVACLTSLLEVSPKNMHEEKQVMSCLLEYAAMRKTDQQHVLRMTDGLWRCLSDNPWYGVLRGIGWHALPLLPGSKRYLAEKAMGFIGELPLSLLEKNDDAFV